jgi:hypothetical protein
MNGLVVETDTSVPPGNADVVSGLRATALTAFPARSHLNRGATLRLSSPYAKPLLFGDGWFSDSPSTSAPGSLGDYQLQQHEKRGRVALGAVSLGWPRFVVISDTTPLMDRFLIADPRAVGWVVRAASLLPLFLTDLSLAGALLLLALTPKANPRNAVTMCLVVTLAIASSSAFCVGVFRPSTWWQSSMLGESGFEPRNFNIQLARWAKQNAIGMPALVRHRTGADQWKRIANAPVEVHFGIVPSDSSTLFGVTLSRCHRVGRLALEDRVVLQNAQVCKISGDARVVLGSQDEAAAFEILSGYGRLLVVLDSGFLSNQSADTGNLEWLRKRVESASNKVNIED